MESDLKLAPHIVGSLIPRTNLIYLGPAPRPAGAIGRNSFGLYRCECGTEKAIRNSSVGPHHTVSCGCWGRKQFIQHHEQVAQSVSPATRTTMFTLARCKGHESREGLAARYSTTPWVIDFVVRLHEKFLLAVQKQGRKAMARLTKFERRWLRRRNKTMGLLNLCRRFGWSTDRIFEPVRMFRRASSLEPLLADPDRPDLSNVGDFALKFNDLLSDPDLEFSIG